MVQRGACSSLSVTTVDVLQLTEARKYTETTHYPMASMPAAIEKMNDVIKSPDKVDYVNGILCSKDYSVIIPGRLIKDNLTKRSMTGFSHSEDPWLYLYVKDSITDINESIVEYISLRSCRFQDRVSSVSRFSYPSQQFHAIVPRQLRPCSNDGHCSACQPSRYAIRGAGSDAATP